MLYWWPGWLICLEHEAIDVDDKVVGHSEFPTCFLACWLVDWLHVTLNRKLGFFRYALIIGPLTSSFFKPSSDKLHTRYHKSSARTRLRRVQERRYEPWRDKTNKMSVRPAKTQTSLGIRPVWPESSLSAWRNLGSLATHRVHSEILIRLSGCPGWSESSLGAQSLCWFCHVAAHMGKILLVSLLR